MNEIVSNQRLLLALILATAAVTYLLRAVPLVLLRRPLRNLYIVALLEYLPYALLSAMVFPAALYATGGASFPSMPPLPSLVGTAVALVLAFFGLNLPLVAGAATLAAYLCTFV